MTGCYITHAGSFLPGDAVSNSDIQRHLGKVVGESWVKEKILRLNGIHSRYYALDSEQQQTYDLYQMATSAATNCFNGSGQSETIEYLSAGSTNTPYAAPGFSSLLHDRLSQVALIDHSCEINTNAGICSSGAQALVNGIRAIRSSDCATALCVGAEQPSTFLKSRAFRPKYDVRQMISNIKNSKWFMSVFLRFMLSDGAGAFYLKNTPKQSGLSWKVDWTYSRSFANEAPLCMTLESKSLLLSQDVRVLGKHMAPYSKQVLQEAFCKNEEVIENYSMILPHMSSYYFERSVRRILNELKKDSRNEVPYWTNLSSAGNTGAASMYIMLDEYMKTHQVLNGERLLLFVPESGQFNYVIISLTAVVQSDS